MSQADLQWLTEDIVTFLIQEGYEVKNDSGGNTAEFFTVVMNNEEYDVAIKDASLRESK